MSNIANTTAATSTGANTHNTTARTTGTGTGLGSSTNTAGTGTQASKTSGAFHDAKGTVKEGLGRATGAHTMAAEGRQEKIAAKEQKGVAKSQGFTQGTADHVQGQQQSMHGSIAGDRSHQTAGEARAAKGHAEQQFNRGPAF